MHRRRPVLIALIPLVLGLFATLDGRADSARRHPVQVGFELAVSSASGEQLQWLYAPAGNLAFTILPGYSVGLQRITGGSVPLAAGERGHFGLTPYVERYHFLRPGSQVFAQAGIGWQSRWGAGLPSATGLALAVAGGFRGWLTPRFSIGAMARVVDVLSNGWAMTPRVLPSGAIVVSLGFMLEGHL